MKRIKILNKYILDEQDYRLEPYKTTDLWIDSIDQFRENKSFREYIMNDAERTGILIIHHYKNYLKLFKRCMEKES